MLAGLFPVLKTRFFHAAPTDRQHRFPRQARYTRARPRPRWRAMPMLQAVRSADATACHFRTAPSLPGDRTKRQPEAATTTRCRSENVPPRRECLCLRGHATACVGQTFLKLPSDIVGQCFFNCQAATLSTILPRLCGAPPSISCATRPSSNGSTVPTPVTTLPLPNNAPIKSTAFLCLK
jgi:hypothetical protein